MPTFLGNHDMGRGAQQIASRAGGVSDPVLRRRVELGYDLLYLLRGAPVVMYGDEVGVIGSGSKIMAVVKANAYGHGLARVLPALEEADGLALVELDAAVSLREQHYMRRILLLEGFFTEEELDEAAHRRLAIVVYNMEQVKMLEAATLARPLEVFVKVNTGMNRLGFRPAAQ
jgi:hypothetical protein